MTDVKITTSDGETRLQAPFNPDLPADAHNIGGDFDRPTKQWIFDARDEDRVRDLARRYFGTDGTTDAGDLVTVRVALASCSAGYSGQYAEFAGRRIAERRYRDAPVKYATNVVLVAGSLRSSGGSMKHPSIGADDDVYVEIRDLPRAVLSAPGLPDYEIVGETIDVAALQAERDRLTARIAEIDTQLKGN